MLLIPRNKALLLVYISGIQVEGFLGNIRWFLDVGS